MLAQAHASTYTYICSLSPALNILPTPGQQIWPSQPSPWLSRATSRCFSVLLQLLHLAIQQVLPRPQGREYLLGLSRLPVQSLHKWRCLLLPLHWKKVNFSLDTPWLGLSAQTEVQQISVYSCPPMLD